jgi:hypothetical protein
MFESFSRLSGNHVKIGFLNLAIFALVPTDTKGSQMPIFLVFREFAIFLAKALRQYPAISPAKKGSSKMEFYMYKVLSQFGLSALTLEGVTVARFYDEALAQTVAALLNAARAQASYAQRRA